MADRTLQIIVNVSGDAPAAINSIRQSIVGLNTAQTQSTAATSANTTAQNANNQATNAAGKTATATAGSFKTFQQSIDENRRSAYAMTIAGYQLVQMGKAVTSVITDSVSQFTDYDFSLRRAAGALGLFGGEGKISLDQVSESVQKLAIQTKLFKPDEVAMGMYYWGSATGQVVENQSDLNKVMSQTLPIMKMAAMTETGLETALKGVFQVLSEFQLPMERANDVTEKLFYTAQKTATEVPDLLQAFKMVGPAAFAMGVSFEDVVKILGILGNLGIKGSQAGRAMSMMFSRLAANTGPATKALDEFAKKAGLIGSSGTFQKLLFPDGKFIGMQGFLNLMTDMTKRLDQASYVAFTKVITTQNEWRILLPLISANTKAQAEFGKGAIDMADNMSGAGDTMDNAWSVLGDSAKALFGELSNHIAPVIYDIAKAAIDSFIPMAHTIMRVADAVHAWAVENRGAMQAIVSIIALTGGLMTLLGTVLLLMGAFRLVTFTAIPTLLAGLLNVNLAVETNTGSLGVYNALLAATKARLSGLGSIRLPALTQGASTIVSPATGPGTIVPAAGGLLGANGILARIAASAVGAARGIGSLAKGLGLLAVIGSVVFGIIAGVSKVFGGVGTVTRTLGGVLTNLGKVVGGVFALLGSVFRALEKGGEAVVFLTVKLVGMTAAFIESIPGVKMLTDVLGTLGGVAGTVVGAVGGIFGWATDQLNGLVESADDAMSRLNGFTPAKPLVTEANKSNREAYRLNAQAARDAAIAAGSAAGYAYSDAEAEALMGSADVVVRAYAAVWTSPQFAAAAADGMKLALEGATKANRNIAIASAQTFVDSYVSAMGDELEVNYQQVSGAIKSLLDSSAPEAQKAGQMLTVAFAKAIASGNSAEIKPAMLAVVTDAIRLINSGKPKMAQQGFQMMAALAQGMLNSVDPKSQTAATLQQIIVMLNSGIPALQAMGMSMAQAVWGPLLTPPDIGRLGPAGARTALAQQQKQWLDTIRKMLPKVSDVAVPKVSGGGGGAKAQIQSPLEKALEVAKQGAELAKALTDLQGYNLKDLVKTAMGGVAEAVVMADKIVAPYAKQMPKKTLQTIADFSDASGKMVDLVKKSIDAFTSLGTYKRPGKDAFKQLATDILYAVRSIVTISDDFKVKALVSASTLSEHATAVVDLIGKAFDSFSKIDPKKGYIRAPAGIFDAITADIKLAVIALGNAAKSMKTDLLERAKALGDAGGSAVKAIGDAFAGFVDMGKYTRVAPETIQALVDDIKLAVEKMSVAAQEFKGDTVKVKAFAETASSVAQAVKDVWDAFQSRTVKNLAEDEHIETVNLGEVFANMVSSLNGMMTVAAGFDDGGIDKIKKMADAAGAVASAIKSFFDLSEGLTKGTGEGETKQSFSTAIAAELAIIASAVAAFVASFKDTGSSLIANLITGMQSQETALAAEVARINAILAGVGGTSTVTFTVATTAKPVQIEHTIKGDVGQLTAAQIAGILNSGTNLMTNIGQAAATR